jgi:hypothetical protein
VPVVRGHVHGGLLPRVGPIRIDPIHTQQHAHDVQMALMAGLPQRSHSRIKVNRTLSEDDNET